MSYNRSDLFYYTRQRLIKSEEFHQIVLLGMGGSSLASDVFQNLFSNATGYPEKNGLTEKQVLNFLKKISKLKNLKSLDIVEYNPLLDKNKKNLQIVKKVLKTFL